MLIPRIIPVLLIKDRGLVKTLGFGDPRYIGDPINAVRIFNEKEVDELILLDIEASREHRAPDIPLIAEIVSEAFMPVTYGGGISTLEDIRTILQTGVEKVSLNRAARSNPALIRQAADTFGSQSIVVSIDIIASSSDQYTLYPYDHSPGLMSPLPELNPNQKPLKTETKVFQGVQGGGFSKKPPCPPEAIQPFPDDFTSPDVVPGLDALAFARKMESLGAGELLVTSVLRDGTMQGYDIPLIKAMSDQVDIPVIACGGAGEVEDFARVIHQAGASAAAAGSYFVFCGSRDAVLITYPPRTELEVLFQ